MQLHMVVFTLLTALQLLQGFWFACFGLFAGAFIAAFTFSSFMYYAYSLIYSKELALRFLKPFVLTALMFECIFVTCQILGALVSHKTSPEIYDHLQKLVGHIFGFCLTWLLTTTRPRPWRGRKSRAFGELKRLLAKLQRAYAPVKR